MLRICTVGLPGLPPAPQLVNVPGFSGPYWGSMMVLVVYLVATVYVGVHEASRCSSNRWGGWIRTTDYPIQSLKAIKAM